jgi:cell division protein FtsB
MNADKNTIATQKIKEMISNQVLRIFELEAENEILKREIEKLKKGDEQK